MELRKKTLKILLLIIVALIIPSLGLINFRNSTKDKEKNYELLNNKEIKINYKGLDINISLVEYLKGVLAAEMPSHFEDEAKKAQVIAAHTYAINRYGYDGVFPTDPSIFQAYLSLEERKLKYKDDFLINEEMLHKIVNEVINKIIVYDEKPIVAIFFSMSGGKTESSSSVFGGNLPYLTTTDSPSETSLPNFTSEVKVDNNTLKKTLEHNVPSLKMSSNPSNEILIESRDEADYVSSIKIGDKEITGTKFRSLFKLPSANFTISKQTDGVSFICKGKGHGVGMSQYGANELAKEKKDYNYILKYFYRGASIKNI